MDSHVLTILVFGLLVTLGVTLLVLCSVIVFGFWYFEKMWNKHSTLMQELGSAVGELRAYKNQSIFCLKGKKGWAFLWFKRITEKHLYLEYRDKILVRVFGDTEDLSAYLELT